ncbi:MAG TPA: TetR family transcriptional regulator [Streptosporangiaceae bacterium]
MTGALHGEELGLPTERRLLLAAERLFAERGIDAVSLRSVMAAAGANVASVHYHFGSKQALVEALISDRSGHVSARRAELLDAIESAGELSPRRLAEAFIRPVAEMASSGELAWVTFIAGIIGSGHPALSMLADGFVPQARRFTALMQVLYPDASGRTIRFRLTQAMSLTFRVLGDPDGSQGLLSLSGAKLTPGEVLGELVDVVTAILAGPADR